MKLFCKPVHSIAEEILYHKEDFRHPGTIHFRSLHETDFDMIHDWVNQPYAKKFWCLEGTRELIDDTYQNILQNQQAHSYIGLFNNRIVCQVDLYLVAADELKDHIEHQPDDCGLHLLMAPPRQLKRGIALTMLRAFVSYYFSFPMAKRLFAEPDRENMPANVLAQKAGFKFLKSITLSTKKATLYCIQRENIFNR